MFVAVQCYYLSAWILGRGVGQGGVAGGGWAVGVANFVVSTTHGTFVWRSHWGGAYAVGSRLSAGKCGNGEMVTNNLDGAGKRDSGLGLHGPMFCVCASVSAFCILQSEPGAQSHMCGWVHYEIYAQWQEGCWLIEL